MSKRLSKTETHDVKSTVNNDPILISPLVSTEAKSDIVTNNDKAKAVVEESKPTIIIQMDDCVEVNDGNGDLNKDGVLCVINGEVVTMTEDDVAIFDSSSNTDTGVNDNITIVTTQENVDPTLDSEDFTEDAIYGTYTTNPLVNNTNVAISPAASSNASPDNINIVTPNGNLIPIDIKYCTKSVQYAAKQYYEPIMKMLKGIENDKLTAKLLNDCYRPVAMQRRYRMRNLKPSLKSTVEKITGVNYNDILAQTTDVSFNLLKTAVAAKVNGKIITDNLTYAQIIETGTPQSKYFSPLTAAPSPTAPHAIGYSIDLQVRGGDAYYAVYEWLIYNAYKFGFFRTVVCEAWHWQYKIESIGRKDRIFSYKVDSTNPIWISPTKGYNNDVNAEYPGFGGTPKKWQDRFTIAINKMKG